MEFVFDQKVETWLRAHGNGLAFFGGSRIVAPDGQDAALVGPGREGLVSAEVDRARVAAAQARLPYLKNCSEL